MIHQKFIAVVAAFLAKLDVSVVLVFEMNKNTIVTKIQKQ